MQMVSHHAHHQPTVKISPEKYFFDFPLYGIFIIRTREGRTFGSGPPFI